MRFLISKGSKFLGIKCYREDLRSSCCGSFCPQSEGTMAGRRRGNAPYPAFAGWPVRKLWAEIGRRGIVAPNNAKKATLVHLLVQDTARMTADRNVCRATRGRRVAAQSDGQDGEPLPASASDDCDETPAPQVRDKDDKVAHLQRTVDMLQSSLALWSYPASLLKVCKKKCKITVKEGAEFSVGDDRQQRGTGIPLSMPGAAHYVTGASRLSRESPQLGATSWLLRTHPSSSQIDQCGRPWSTCQQVAVRQLFCLYQHHIKQCRVRVFLLMTLNMLISCLLKSNRRSGKARMSIWPPCWYRVLFRSMSSTIVKCTCQTVS